MIIYSVEWRERGWPRREFFDNLGDAGNFIATFDSKVREMRCMSGPHRHEIRGKKGLVSFAKQYAHGGATWQK